MSGSEHPAFGENFLWNCEIPASAGSHLPAESYYLHPRSINSNSTDKSLNWVPVRHLPLRDDFGPLYGMTIYCTPNGMVGIASHFKALKLPNHTKTTFLGHRVGCPLHFRLNSMEEITSIWLIQHCKDAFEMPFIVVSFARNILRRYVGSGN